MHRTPGVSEGGAAKVEGRRNALRLLRPTAAVEAGSRANFPEHLSMFAPKGAPTTFVQTRSLYGAMRFAIAPYGCCGSGLAGEPSRTPKDVRAQGHSYNVRSNAKSLRRNALRYCALRAPRMSRVPGRRKGLDRDVRPEKKAGDKRAAFSLVTGTLFGNSQKSGVNSAPWDTAECRYHDADTPRVFCPLSCGPA